MKLVLIYVVLACFVVMSSSQPTHDFSDDTDCDCQHLQSQIDAIKHYLQEAHIIKPLPPPRPPTCPENFTYVQSIRGCYYVELEKLQWFAAIQRCVSLHPDAHLVIIGNTAEQTVVAGLLSQYPANAVDRTWTAGQLQNLTDYTSPYIWRVLTSHSYTELPIGFKYFATNEPDQLGEHCLAVARGVQYRFCRKRYSTEQQIALWPKLGDWLPKSL